MTGTEHQDHPVLLDARDIVKSFGTFRANDHVSLSIRAGEIHALLGENGAGKSTLVKMIYGLMQPDQGSFSWQGERVTIASPTRARQLGIAMVFQHFSLFESLTVAENIALALPDRSLAAIRRDIVALSERYGLSVKPDRAVLSLSVGEQQRVEIVRCLLQNPTLLIMDEPTSVLTPQEADVLFRTLRQLSDDGCAILYISHRLDEIRALCSHATILRHGQMVAHVDPRDKSPAELAELMVGDAVADVERHARDLPDGQPLFSVSRLSLPATDRFGVSLDNVTLSVRRGEILGIAGIAGNGQSELMAALIGEVRVAAEHIRINGQSVGHLGPNRRRRVGMAFVPEERRGHAAVPDMSLAENTMLTLYKVGKLTLGSILRPGKAQALAKDLVRANDVRTASDNPLAGSLSGGNLQKFIVGRELHSNPDVLIVAQPTWGVDAAAAAFIRQELVNLARDGTAVLLISQDLEEIFAIADKVSVLNLGALSAAQPVGDMTPESIGLLMGGAEAATLDGRHLREELDA